MKNIFFVFILFAFANINSIVCAKVITNQQFYDSFAGLEDRIECGNAATALSEIDAAMSADIVPWQMPVIKGKDWACPWGLFAHILKARALQKTGKLPDAYRALMDGYSYLPEKIPPKEFSREYWRWWLLASELCNQLGRRYDADWYMTKVKNAFTTNDSFYFKALAGLAQLYGRQGRYLKADKFYKELFRFRPLQKTPVWKNYIRFQFNSGNFENGVALILKGVKINGISPQKVEKDFLVCMACRYWHFFHRIDVFEWYELLGNQLDKQELASQNEKLFAFLINTRNLIKKSYPELFAIPDDDISALKNRLEAEKTNKLSTVNYQLFLPKKSPSKKTPSKPIFSINPANNYLQYTNVIIEDAVNKILYDAAKTKKYDRGNVKSWKKIIEQFDTNQLSSVTIDGGIALFLVYSQIGIILCDEYKHSEGKKWLKKALDLNSITENKNRLVEVLLWVGEIYLSRHLRNIDEAKYYLNWATDLIGDNIRQLVEVESQLSGIAIINGGPENRIKILQELVDKYGCTPRQHVYERLARDYYRLGECREGFEILIEGIKRTPLKMDSGRFNHFIAALTVNQSFHTSEELKTFREIVQTSALRNPATFKKVKEIARMFSLAQEPWIDNQIRLAEIQENKSFTEENWLFISNSVFSSPSIRAGLLYTEAQIARDTTKTNIINWIGWQKGWIIAEKETKSKFVPIDSGVRDLRYNVFINQLIDNKQRIDANSKQKIYKTICNNIDQLNNLVFNSVVDFFIDAKNPENVFELHFSRMTTLQNSSTKNPSFKVMVEMYNKLEKKQKLMLEELLRNKYKYEKKEESKEKWIEFMVQCGIENLPNTL